MQKVNNSPPGGNFILNGFCTYEKIVHFRDTLCTKKLINVLLQVHKIEAKTVPISNAGQHQNTHYVSEIINPTNGIISHNATVLTSTQSSNNSRNPVIQQVIMQPAELLPIIAKRDPPRESPIHISK